MVERPPHIMEFISLAEGRRAVEVPIQYLPILGLMLAEPGITPTHMGDLLSMDIDALSRVLKVLRVDYEVCDFEPDAQDSRKKHFYLTQKGLDQAVAWLRARGHAVPDDLLKSTQIIKSVAKPKSRVGKPKK
jgi:hypothetical protein